MSDYIQPLKVAVLCSHRAPGLVTLLNADARRGCDYEVVCCLTSSDTFAEEVKVERRGVPCVSHPIRSWCQARNTVITDLGVRREYDQRTVQLLAPFKPDLLLLAGYLLLLTDPVLSAFDGRIVNIHHADLFQRADSGTARYPGLRAVRDAIVAGEAETRATAHIVTPRLDDGPVLLRSWSFPVAGAARWAVAHDASDVLRAAVWAHQEWMLRDAWAPMLSRSIELGVMALHAAGRPLNLALCGRWELTERGALVPEAASPEEVWCA